LTREESEKKGEAMQLDKKEKPGKLWGNQRASAVRSKRISSVKKRQVYISRKANGPSEKLGLSGNVERGEYLL